MAAVSIPQPRAIASIAIIDDDENVLAALDKILTEAKFAVRTFSSPGEAVSAIIKEPSDVILCDLKMPEMDGLEVTKQIQAARVPTTMIIMSAYGSLDLALQAMKLGAYDYIAKPFHADELLLTIRKVEERERLRVENADLKQQVTRKYSFQNIVASSRAMLDVLDTVKKIADYKTTVMIHGESGTGKELVARAVHFNSSRKQRAFVAINCGAIPENLLESELFGHKRGAFTDATRDKKGLFEEADGGTLFLDEIGELPLHLQVKLLRVLQESEIRPVGDSKTIKIDVRVVAATLRDLEQDVLEGRFRDDLYYRLNVINLHIPALRSRREDIPVLTEHFLIKHREKLKLSVNSVSKEAMALLLEYPWPGNIRELENYIERAMILTDGDTILPEHLPLSVRSKETKEPDFGFSDANLSIKFHSRRLEESLIKRALLKTGGNRTRAARLLEISHRTLLYKLKEFQLAAADEHLASEGNEGESDER